MTKRISLLVAFLFLVTGCGSKEKDLILEQLTKAVMQAEKMAIEDSELRSNDCMDEPQPWRAPISSLTQDIRVQRCDIVYYYLARYAQVEGDIAPIAFVPFATFIGTENLTTGEKVLAEEEI